MNVRNNYGAEGEVAARSFCSFRLLRLVDVSDDSVLNQSRYAIVMSVIYRSPHRGLPPCRRGEAYAPMTRTII